MRSLTAVRWALLSSLVTACGGAQVSEDTPPPAICEARGAAENVDSERVVDTPLTFIVGGTVFTAAGPVYDTGWVALEDGRIVEVGEGEIEPPNNAVVIDATGRFITPGVIDTHSHLGVYPSPSAQAHRDGNEATNRATPEVHAMHSVWPQDPGFERAMAGGVTAMQILPGSANLVGGEGFIMQNLPGARNALELAFPGAPRTLKMACGENPKRVYGERGGPSTRMGSTAAMRQLWIDAQQYREAADDYDDAIDEWCEEGADPDEEPDAPARSIGSDTMAAVLRGDVMPQIHCYRADEMLTQLQTAEEFGFEIRSFHHATSAYKIRDVLAEHQVAVSTWADWWGFKLEAFDSIVENAALVHEAGGISVIHSDSAYGIQRLNQEAAKAYYHGLRGGIELTEDDAVSWFTSNAAWALGIEDETGSLEVGKRGDVVIWSAHPLSIYARADVVFVEGTERWDRASQPEGWSDFETGLWPQLDPPDAMPSQHGPTLATPTPASERRPIALGTSRNPAEQCFVNAWVAGAGSDPFVGGVCWRDSELTQIGPSVTPAPDAIIYDVEHRVITPGFVDVYTGLGLVEVSAVEATRHASEETEDDVRAAFHTRDAFDRTSSLIGVTRSGGVTSVMSAPNGGLIPGQAAWFTLSETPEVGPSALVMTFGRRDNGSRAGTILRYREILSDAAVYFRFREEFDRAGLRELSVSRLDLAALESVLSGDVPVFAHAPHREDIADALALAEEFGLRLILVGADDAWAMADVIAAANVPVVVEPFNNLPSNFDHLGAREDGTALLAAAGVRVIVSTRSAHNVRLLRYFAGNAVRAGLPWGDALAAVTSTPADVMGLGGTLGELVPGQRADFVVWSGDPFETSSFPDAMVIAGEPTSMHNRQAALFERYRVIPESP